MSDTNANRPSHRLFNVMGDGDNARWTDIGVAWATKDGKGFTLLTTMTELKGHEEPLGVTRPLGVELQLIQQRAHVDGRGRLPGIAAREDAQLIHRDNTFGTPEEDAFRRDFTINAMFYDIATFSIIDYVGGLEDLRAGIVRCIGDPVVRFKEDPVRMLRAIALAARLDFTIEDPIYDAIGLMRHEIANSSAPRLLEEYYKILRAGSSEATFQGLSAAGLLEPISAELHDGAGAALWQSLRNVDAYRKKFTGTPEHVVNYMFFVAEELREYMAQLGFRTWSEMVGRVDLLDMRKGLEHWKARGLDFGRLFVQPQVSAEVPRLHVDKQDHNIEHTLDRKLIERSRPAIDKGERVQFIEVVRNVNRSVGAMLSGAVTRLHPDGLPDDTIRIQLEGTGGQSFGAFLCNGITMYLIGDANDYTGKGLSGGRVVVRPSIDFRGDAWRNIIVGNTVMYGATTGEAFFSGVAGERFAVRLSGATAVVEGTGDHGCEYMTGGTVAVLGKTGRNFAAGMSGGIAYVYDEDGQFAKRCNTAMVTLEKVLPVAEQEATVDRGVWHREQTDEAQLRKLLEDHNRWTGSKRARELLDNWAEARGKFVKVFPNEYKRALGEIYARKMAKSSVDGPKAATKKEAVAAK